jgi:EF-P beta-lysylation protein EpmB
MGLGYTSTGESKATPLQSGPGNDYSLSMTILATQSESVRAGSETWQQQMKSAIRDVETLRLRLKLPVDSRIGAKAAKQFPVFVPLPFLGRMSPGDPDDPLLRQVLPVSEEDEAPSGFSLDPLHESAAARTPGMLQKYAGRVLLITTGACAIHCRYCFRRHFPYQDSPKSGAQWQSAIEQIADDPSIEEVILSGGDPLTLVDEQLATLIEQLKPIRHLKRLRVHTRLPIMIPQRVTARLVEILTDQPFHPVVVIHANHANELDESVRVATRRLLDAGVTMLNQTVLLRGVNDNAAVLIQLSQRLLDCRVLPYYLHQLDPVVGAAHFEVAPERGLELIQEMRAALPGYAVPRYVKELAGEPNKTSWA